MKYVMSHIQRMILLKKTTMQYKRGITSIQPICWNMNSSYILNNRTPLLCCQYLYDDNTETIYVWLVWNSSLEDFWCEIAPVKIGKRITKFNSNPSKMIWAPRILISLLCSHDFWSDSMGLLFIKASWDTKVCNFRHHIIVQQYISRFQIWVNNSFIVEIL